MNTKANALTMAGTPGTDAGWMARKKARGDAVMRISLVFASACLGVACGSPPSDFIWQHQTDRPRFLAGDSQMQGPVVAGVQAVFCGGYGWDNGGYITAVNVWNGERRWAHHVGRCHDRPLVTSTEAIGWRRPDASQGLIKAIDLESGAVLWQRDLHPGFHVARLQHETLYLRLHDAVLAIAARTGAVIPHPIAGCEERGARAWMAVDDTRVLAGCNNGLYTLDGRTLVTLEAPMQQVVDTVLSGDTLYVAQPERLLAFDLPSGRVVWQRQFAKVLSSLLVDGDAIYVHASKPWALHRLDRHDGRDVWTSMVHSFHAPVRVAEALYTNDGASLVLLNPATGELLWRWKAPGEISAPPAIAGDALLFGTLKGVLYSVRVPQ